MTSQGTEDNDRQKVESQKIQNKIIMYLDQKKVQKQTLADSIHKVMSAYEWQTISR